jgi:hypothetical protein
MGARLNIEISQHAQQSGPDIDAFATGERHQSVEARKKRRSGHGELNATASNSA